MGASRDAPGDVGSAAPARRGLPTSADLTWPDSGGPDRSCAEGSWVAVALAVMNVASYAFTVVAAHLLGPVGYGAFAAMMGLVLVVSVASLGLQATAARRVAADPSHRWRSRRSPARRPTAPPPGLALVALVASPLVGRVLHLDTWLTAALLAVPAAAYVVMGGQTGLLQGEGRWRAYAAVFSAFGLARLGCGLTAIWWWPTPLGAMTGVAVGAIVPAASGGGPCDDPVRRVVRPGLGRGGDLRGDARGRGQQHRAARLLRADQPRRAAGPGRAAASPGRVVRRRGDPREGRDVPAVRAHRDDVPSDGPPGRAPSPAPVGPGRRARRRS